MPFRPKWFVAGDIDGFFGLALDNLIQVLVILTLSTNVLRFDDSIILGRMLPAIGISLAVGNLFYAYQAYKLAQKTGRTDVCALPYGINTVTIFANIFLVMLPVKLAAVGSGSSEHDACELALSAGVVATLASGAFEVFAAFFVVTVRKLMPRAAMLSTLAGIAMTFIAGSFLLRGFASPIVSFVPIGIVFATYFGRVKLPWRLPGGFIAIAAGTLIAWLTGAMKWDSTAYHAAISHLGWHWPVTAIGAIVAGFAHGHFQAYLSIVLPMGLFGVVGSIQNLESANAAGDDYDARDSLLANGIGTVVGAALGSPFPTTLYIGHPGWKALGARIGYSALNGVFFALLSMTGAASLVGFFVPIEAGLAIVLWIGIVMTAQAFTATPKEHAPAVAVGLLPALGAWGAMLIKSSLRIANADFGPQLLPAFQQADIFLQGAFALEQGFLLSATIWATMTVFVIEQRFWLASAWAAAGASMAFFGLIHAFRWAKGDTIGWLGPGHAMPWTFGYLALAVLFLVAGFFRARSIDSSAPSH